MRTASSRVHSASVLRRTARRAPYEDNLAVGILARALAIVVAAIPYSPQLARAHARSSALSSTTKRNGRATVDEMIDLVRTVAHSPNS